MAANPTNEILPLQVAGTYNRDKNYDEALKFVDQSIKIKETFQNLSAKANILWAGGQEGRCDQSRRRGDRQGQSRQAPTPRLLKSGSPI